jgi:3-hydroxyisobutyrate dehydrogenase-like beta-hydroxyacid dehydrogenase
MSQSRKHTNNVGVIGLGIIGTRVAAGLRHCGFNAYVWNRTPKPAPNFLGSSAEVAELCDIIQLFVADADAVMKTIDALSDVLTPDHLIICNATIGLQGTLDAAKRVREIGARFLDAPFTGSKGAADRRQLVYYIGGDEQDFLRAQPVLEATSKAIVRIGEVGQAAVVKVVTNLISAVTAQTLAEAIENNAMRSGVTDLKLPAMISGDYTPHFALKHMFKDVQLGIQLANQFGLEVPATGTVGAVMYSMLTKGCGDLDYAAVFKAYEQPAAK